MAGVTYGDMPPAELRRHGHAAVDWVADYLTRIGELPVLPDVRPGDVAAQLPEAPPDGGEAVEAILADLDRVIVPGLTHWNHPRFLAYFAVTASGPGIIGELLTAAMNANGMLWRTAPAATELEQVTLDWLRQLLGLPSGFHGVIQDTASVATLCALAAARQRRFPEVREEGPAGYGGVRPRVYASEQAHSSVEKACTTLGLGRAGFRAVPTDDAFRMDPAALERAIAEDTAEGWAPLAVVATVGTTSTTSVDPVPAVAEVCRRHGAWLHVDGAYGGTAAVVPEIRHVLDGVGGADSLVVNPHKWLFTPIDCSAFYVRDPAALTAALSLVPEYLRTGEDVTNYMDWGVALGRRFRALKLWMVIRYFGREGIVSAIREHVRLAGLAADRLTSSDRFEVVAPVPFSVVCFRLRGADDATNAALLEAVNATGRAYLSHTVLRDRYVLRLAVGNLRTTEADVAEVLDLLETESARI